MIAILDYKAGNQTSVRRSLEHMGIPCAITADPDCLARASGVIFPGVGAAGQAMRQLREDGLDQVLAAVRSRGTPLLGVCLGCQILLESSEENGHTPTLGLIPGLSRRFDAQWCEEDGEPIRIPHMGWNRVQLTRPSPLFAQIPEGAQFYFVHSYYVDVAPELVLATCQYGHEFCAAYGQDGLWAVQFHPEKSGQPGLQLLHNFYEYCQRAGRPHAE